MNWVPFRSRYMCNLRESSRKNGWNTNRHPKTAKLKASQARSARGGLCPVRSVRALSATFWALLVLRFGPRILSMLGHLELPLLSSLIHMALNFTLSPITWLISHESTIKTRKSWNKHNWRNRGVNHKVKPIYPQEWILKTQLILCKYGTDQTAPWLYFCLSSSKTLYKSN